MARIAKAADLGRQAYKVGGTLSAEERVSPAVASAPNWDRGLTSCNETWAALSVAQLPGVPGTAAGMFVWLQRSSWPGLAAAGVAAQGYSGKGQGVSEGKALYCAAARLRQDNAGRGHSFAVSAQHWHGLCVLGCSAYQWTGKALPAVRRIRKAHAAPL